MKSKVYIFCALVIAILSSCTKEKCTEMYDGVTYTPVYAPMSSLRNVTVQVPKSITSNGKIFTKGNFIYLNEVNKGFHIIDNRNPSAPINIAFVNVPGNIDMIAKGNYLMVDNYIDLLTFDISNPTNIQLIKRTENALPYRQYNYGFSDNAASGIITSFDRKLEKREVDCSFASRGFTRLEDRGGIFMTLSSAAPTKALGGANGQAGSLSRFAQLNNYLYIANRFSITPIDITNPLAPVVKAVVQTGEVETLYGFNNVLLVGSPSGMFIYGINNPAIPNYLSGVTHWRGCDPVVAENNLAYVTVRGGGPCGGDRNILDVIDITDLTRPNIIKTYQMQNPYGLGIFNNKLGVCDGDAGFKLYDASNSANIVQQSIVSNIKAYDVIMNNDIALLIAKDGMYQYRITNSTAPVLLSKIAILN
jgi:hypothetical protein